MHYLFLDIDGVLNHETWYRDVVYPNRSNYIGGRDNYILSCFDPECVKRVNTILAETGARLVVSSSWRIDNKLKDDFERIGLPTDFDITPIKHWTQMKSIDEEWATRGEEIEEFLESHPCNNYVIIDDDTDFTEEQLEKHFVRCFADVAHSLEEGNEGETGLTERKMLEAIKILKYE